MDHCFCSLHPEKLIESNGSLFDFPDLIRKFAFKNLIDFFKLFVYLGGQIEINLVLLLSRTTIAGCDCTCQRSQLIIELYRVVEHILK